MARTLKTEKGDLGVETARYLFTKKGWIVSQPNTESAPYDLIVDDFKGRYRVQVKYTSDTFVDLRRKRYKGSRPNYEDNSYDWLAVVTPEERLYLFNFFVKNKRSIALDKQYLL